MKKSLLLLLFIGTLSLGCKKDSSNETNYQVDQYSDEILGHWKIFQVRGDSTTTKYLINPVFGEPTVEVLSFGDTTINYPTLNNGNMFDYYITFRDDNSLWSDYFQVNTNYWLNTLQNFDTSQYVINGRNLTLSYVYNSVLDLYDTTYVNNYIITRMFETTMITDYVLHDTINVSSNEYKITRYNNEVEYNRVEELPVE